MYVQVESFGFLGRRLYNAAVETNQLKKIH